MVRQIGGAARHVKGGELLFGTPDVPRREYLRRARRNGNVLGLAVAAALFGCWASLLHRGLFRADPARDSAAASAVLVLLLIYTYTGLFITAHEAMHGHVCPGSRRLNNAVGWLCAKSYALFDYRTLTHAHWAHHRKPGVVGEDPDFHDGVHRGAVAWYCHFMCEYATPWQLAGMGAVFNALHLLGGVPVARLLLFWVAPSLLSSVQLFYFGVYLPHRDDQPFVDRHRAATDYTKGALYHLLTCFNFGLHHEHHVLPFLPWWRLGMARGATAPKAA